ncbi:MAG: GNAT family N-acetyltransferase [bacterium]|nr:GNAT family N-acetyltransferase [bacterium]
MCARDDSPGDGIDDGREEDDRIVFRVAETEADLLRVMVVRGIVFHDEQGVDWADEFDADDADAVHVVGEADGQPVASGRLCLLDGGWAKLGRVAVREQWRGCGYAHGMVGVLLQEAARRGARKLKLHAQVYLEDFYAGYGFKRQGGVFQECGIDHLLMTRED